ncbi:MAG: hypothetical protein V1806_12235 [Pseudomonadota bacterium]
MNLLRSKTFWTGAAGALTALGAYCSGQADAVQAIQMGLTSLLAIFLRAGMTEPAQPAKQAAPGQEG